MKKQFVFLIVLLIFLALLVGFIVFFQTKKDSGEEINKEENVLVNSVDEKVSVEKYIRENIKDISPENEVLGGIWYVVDLQLDLEKNTGKVIYEDGHIQKKANFKYIFDSQFKKVFINEFEIEV